MIEPVVGRLIGDNSDYVKSLQDAERRTGSMVDNADSHFGRLRSSIGGVAAVIGTLGAGAAVVGFFKGAYTEAEEARKSIAQTNAVLQSTGGVANVTARDVGALADRLSALSGIDDEVIAGGENLLLTFTNVRNQVGKGNDVFNQGTKAALDMSVAMKQDLQGSTVLVGKALNDPIKGVTALTRVGVSFTEQQKDQIKTLVESGRTLDAQKIILKELNTEFGGSAAAAASPMARLKVAFGNLQEQIGTALMPTLASLATFLADRLPGAIEGAGRIFGPIIDGIKLFIGSITGAGANVDVGRWTNPIIDAGARVRQVFDDLLPVLRGVFDFVRDNAVPVMIGLGAAIALIISPVALLAAGLIYAYTQFDGLRTVVDAVVSFLTGTVLPAIAAFVVFVATEFANLVGWVQENWAGISEAIGHAVAVAQAVIEVFVGFVSVLWGAFGDEILAVARVVWDQIRNVVDTVVAIISGIIETGLALINGEWGAAWDGIKGILAAAWDFIRETVVNAFRLFGQYIEGGLSAVLLLVGGLPARILGALGNLGGLLWDAGINLIEGLIGGIRAMAGRAASAAWDVVKGAVSAAWNALRPGSPSREGAAIGVNFGQGLVAGMAKMRGEVAGAAGSLVAGAISAAGGTGGPTLGGLGGGGAVAAGSAIAATAAGGQGGAQYYVSVQIVTPTGDIPDSTMRKFRKQLLRMSDDYPAGSILPAA